PPAGFRADLRPYQRRGFAWLQFLADEGLGGVLADDMGLGKTVQTLAHILAEKEAGRLDKPFLVVAPTSLIPTWREEAARFAPDLRVLVMHGLDRPRDLDALTGADLVLTTYPLLARDGDLLTKVEWRGAALDEAQAIKNPTAKWTLAACRLKADHRLCLTGTPVENHLGEAWSQFAFLMPGLLGDSRTFAKFFRTPIEKKGDGERRGLLARRLKPFLLRRTKGEVAAELPPKTEVIRHVELAGAQRDLYETLRLAMDGKVRQAVAAKGLARSAIVILDALLKLRQACCDPRLVKLRGAAKTGIESAKLDHLMEFLPELVEEGRRVLLFSQFTGMLDLIKLELAKAGIPYVELTGDTKDRETPVKTFQSGAVPLFLISLKAGGVGLTLTAADTVIHYDPWWNPAVEDQATDRAHRIGQDKPVFVYKLIAAGTVEERMVELQSRKRAVAAALFNEDGGDVPVFSEADLAALFQPLG
ncbi:MAG TPA: DEAD/DEAH box helicase, partial [Azospirillaceae bacterium]|nr:DEAD/DEAH box helicase [Azospirillaceae bacterium]